jgi:hypothetical protein
MWNGYTNGLLVHVTKYLYLIALLFAFSPFEFLCINSAFAFYSNSISGVTIEQDHPAVSVRVGECRRLDDSFVSLYQQTISFCSAENTSSASCARTGPTEVSPSSVPAMSFAARAIAMICILACIFSCVSGSDSAVRRSFDLSESRLLSARPHFTSPNPEFTVEGLLKAPAYRVKWAAPPTVLELADAPPLQYSVFAEWAAPRQRTSNKRHAESRRAKGGHEHASALHSTQVCSLTVTHVSRFDATSHCLIAAGELPVGIEISLRLMTECNVALIAEKALREGVPSEVLATQLRNCSSAMSPPLLFKVPELPTHSQTSHTSTASDSVAPSVQRLDSIVGEPFDHLTPPIPPAPIIRVKNDTEVRADLEEFYFLTWSEARCDIFSCYLSVSQRKRRRWQLRLQFCLFVLFDCTM